MTALVIPVSGELEALVSPEDFARASKHSWCRFSGGGSRQITYAQTNIKIDSRWRRVLLHRFIMCAQPGQMVDHFDGNGLNCQRGNLRFASWSKAMKRWRAQIMAARVHRELGYFELEEDAARAYDDAARLYHGEFARTNFNDRRTA